MSKAVQLVGIVGLGVVLAGCASMGKGKSAEEQIRAELEPWAAAFVAQDLDTLMTYYSDDFSHYEYGDKAGLRDYLQDAIDMGYLDNAEVDLGEVVVMVDGDTAKVDPIEMTASFGSAVIGLTLTKDGSDWEIIGMDVEMQ